MSKELEALENIKHYDTRVGLHEDDYNIIETALKRISFLEKENKELNEQVSEVARFYEKRLEEIDNRKIVGTVTTNEALEKFLIQQCPDIEKKLKALEIIKKKDVHIHTLKVWNKTYKGKLNYQIYLDILEDCDLGEPLTQEEFDLLKDTMVVMTI